MAPTVQRHTQLTADRIKTSTISASEAGRIIASKAIPRDRLSYLIQSGTARIGTTRYVEFPTSFSHTPNVALSRAGSFDYPAVSGSVAELTLMTRVSGSFSAQGTPTGNVTWLAQGSA